METKPISGTWDDPSSAARNDIVFENRNKAYGAYLIRTKYKDYVTFAALIGITSFALSVSGPKIYDLIISNLEEAAAKKDRKAVSVAELAAPPPMDEKVQPPPPIKPPELKTVKFTPPVVKPDEEVVEEVATMEEMDKAVIGTKNIEGDTVAYQPIEETQNVVIEEEQPTVFKYVEEMPEFPGGEEELIKFISKNINYPPIARENGITGRVTLAFVVGNDGSISNINVLRDIGGGCAEEAIRVVKKMPKWKAGRQNGKPVNVEFNLPINFELR